MLQDIVSQNMDEGELADGEGEEEEEEVEHKAVRGEKGGLGGIGTYTRNRRKRRRCGCVGVVVFVTLIITVWALRMGVGVDSVLRNTPTSTPVSAFAKLEACNGMRGLCAARYDQAAYGTVHNAYSSLADGFALPNNMRSMRDALWEGGVRGLMLDIVKPDKTKPSMLCHVECALGSMPLLSGMVIIADFLTRNPREVVTIIWEFGKGERKVMQEELEAAVNASGLSRKMFRAENNKKSTGVRWPTLGEMVEKGTTLVSFSDVGRGSERWDLHVWDHLTETPYAFNSKAAMSVPCTSRNRGDPANSLFLVNHFVTGPLPSPSLATEVNYDPFLYDRAKDCALRTDPPRRVNFLAVDFWSMSDLSTAVDALNMELLESLLLGDGTRDIALDLGPEYSSGNRRRGSSWWW